MNLIAFGFYALCIVILLAYIAIFVMHIGHFRQYSKYINPVLKIYLTLVIIISIWGGYKVLTDTTKPVGPTVQKARLNF